MIESILLSAAPVATFIGQKQLTNASGFFFERDDRLFLVTSRHVMIDEPSKHFPDRIEIELHNDPENIARTTGFSIPLYQAGQSVWRQGMDSAGGIDVAAIEIDRSVLPETAVSTLVVVPGPAESVYAVIDGNIWMSNDSARNWQMRVAGLPAGHVDTLAVDSKKAGRLWSAASAQVFASDDAGTTWKAYGRPLPEPNTNVRGITASEEVVVVTTDRGLYRTVDSGERWTLIIENLPAHLGAGPLVSDPVDPATLYAGFALVPYPEIWRRAADREGALVRVSVTSLAGSVVVVVMIALVAFAALRWLGHYYRPPARSGPAKRTTLDRRMEKTLP